MILQCPNCETRYEIPVQLPPEGRKVRCASCQHIWNATPADQPSPEEILANFQDEEIVFKDGKESAPGPADSGAESGADSAPEAEAEAEADGSFSDSDMEEAFQSAVEDAAGEDAEPDEGDATDDEEESPPIVIGKAKKKRGPLPANLAAGWAALALALAGVTSAAYFQRVSVVRALPGAASTYESLGIPVNVRGLNFEKVKYSWESSAGRPVLEVYGDIVNVTEKALKVPTVVFGLRTKEKVEVYQWAADVRAELLPAGQRTAFSAQIPTPPKSIRDVQVRFAKVR